MIDKFRNIIFFLAFTISFSVIGYFGINWLLGVPSTNNQDPYFKKETKYIIVDSLLVVVDSLQVQVDSLHLVKNKSKLIYIPQSVDTAFIIDQYYKTYKQTIKHRDKDLDLKLSFDLIQNKIQAPKLKYKILKPITIITQNKNHFLIGVTVGGSQFELDQLTPELIFLRGKHGFKIGYNLLNENRNLQIGYYFKIN